MSRLKVPDLDGLMFSRLGALSPYEYHLSILTRPCRHPCCSFPQPRPISTVGKCNPSHNQCSLFNSSYWLACRSTDVRERKNTNKLDGRERTTDTVAPAMKSRIFNNELLVAREERREGEGSEGENEGKHRRNGSIWTDNHQALSRCVKSVTLQRWARQGRDQWAAFRWSVILNYL